MLDALGVGLEQARAEVVRIVGEGEPDHEAGRPRRFTPRAKKALQLAFREARTLLSDAIDTEHVLLGLIRDRDAVAARILAGLGAEAGVVRVELFRVLQRAA